MTRIEFFFNVDKKLEKAAELSEKAALKGRRLMLLAPDEEALQVLETRLWSGTPTSFLPHCRGADALASETPIILACETGSLPHHDILINLQSEYPSCFSRFTRLIEIVGLDEEDKVAARKRYKFYRDRGYELRSFDTSGAAL